MEYLKKIITQDEAKKKFDCLKKDKQKTVFTNGCFDLLHPGHVRYLQEAAMLGDFLLIALNSDKSVARLKGDKRPICSEDIRSEMLAALSMVDAVVIFDEDTPLKLIKFLNPDVLVKGGDWKINDIVGGREVERAGGTVKSLSLTDGFSSTNLIENIIKRYQ